MDKLRNVFDLLICCKDLLSFYVWIGIFLSFQSLGQGAKDNLGFRGKRHPYCTASIYNILKPISREGTTKFLIEKL